MSQYTLFYIKTKNDIIPIGCYSRNHNIARFADPYAPYGKLKYLSRELIQNIIDDIEKEQFAINAEIAHKEKQIDNILVKAKNSLSEKLEVIEGINEELDDIKEELNYLNYSQDYFCFLLNDIIDNAEDEYDKHKYILFGIEAGKDCEIIE